MATIDGTNGDDVLNGTDNADVISGLDGADIIDGRLGADTLNGGSGNDRFLFSSVLSTTATLPVGTIDGSDGFDEIDLRNIRPSQLQLINDGFSLRVGSQRFDVTRVERILFGSDDNFINGDTTQTGVEIRAGDGADTFQVGGAVRAFGEEGNDRFFIHQL